MIVDGLLVERVDLGRLSGPTARNYLLGNDFHRRPAPPGEEDARSLTRKGPCDGATDRPAGSVDDRDFVVQHADTDTASSR